MGGSLRRWGRRGAAFFVWGAPHFDYVDSRSELERDTGMVGAASVALSSRSVGGRVRGTGSRDRVVDGGGGPLSAPPSST